MNGNTETAPTTDELDTGDFGLELLRWFEAQPGWANLGPKRREIASYLCLNEADEKLSTLTHRELWKIAADSGYTVDQLSSALKAMRRADLVVTKQHFVDSERGFGRRQIGSRNYAAIGARYVPSRKRQEAARRGLAERCEPRSVGRVPFTQAEDDEVRRQVRNRDYRECEHCGRGFSATKSWQRFCSSGCRWAARDRAKVAVGETPAGAR